jgi:hypothetical protein
VIHLDPALTGDVSPSLADDRSGSCGSSNDGGRQEMPADAYAEMKGYTCKSNKTETENRVEM